MHVDAVFSWASIGVKEVPMQLYVTVKKQSEGYRIDSIQIDYDKNQPFRGFLLLDAHPFPLYYKNGNSYTVANSYREAFENLKPNLADKHAFDAVFFSWYQSLISTPSKAN